MSTCCNQRKGAPKGKNAHDGWGQWLGETTFAADQAMCSAYIRPRVNFLSAGLNVRSGKFCGPLAQLPGLRGCRRGQEAWVSVTIQFKGEGVDLISARVRFPPDANPSFFFFFFFLCVFFLLCPGTATAYINKLGRKVMSSYVLLAMSEPIL